MSRPEPSSDLALAVEVDPRGWHAVAWSAYERLPRSADGLLGVVYRAGLLLANLRVPLSVLRGTASSGDRVATVVVAGALEEAEYLARQFFAGEPERESLGWIPVWRVASELERRRDTADLLITRLDRLSARLFLPAQPMAVPEWVGGLLPVPDEPRQLMRQSKGLKNMLNRLRHGGLRPLVSHEDRDFQAFFDEMYVPFIRRRHGPKSVVRNRSVMRRCFRQGGLLWALREGERVAGCLYRTRGRIIDAVAVGTPKGDWQPIAAGAGFALDLFLVEHAKQLGCELVDFGGSRPSLRDGLLLYKARWGARVVEKQTTWYDLNLSWARLNDAVLSFFARVPLIFRDVDGLSALWAVGRDPSAVHADLVTSRAALRTLRRLYLLGAPSDVAVDLGDIETVLIDPTAQPGWHPGSASVRRAGLGRE